MNESRKLPEHLFLAHDGALYDTRDSEWSRKPPLRPRYSWAGREIRTVADLKAALRAGPYSWPGGYEFVYYTADGATLCQDAVRGEFRQIVETINDSAYGARSGWRVCALGTLAECEGLVACDHTGRIMQEDENEEESAS